MKAPILRTLKPLPSPAFTLLELLTVMGVIALLLSLTMPAINSIGAAGRLGSAARLVSNMMTIARSEAINSRAPVQLRIVTDKWTAGAENYDAHYRKMSLWKYDRDANSYRQFSRWETLPPGVLVQPGPDPSSTYSFPSSDSPGLYFLSSAPDSSLQDIAVNGATVNAASFEFSPNGSLQTGGTPVSRSYLLLVEGHIPEGQSTPVSTHAGQKNWAQIRVSPLTGRITVVRP